MKILITSNPNTHNIYVATLFQAMGKLGKVEADAKSFWDNSKEYNLIHIQWPEELIGWQTPQQEDIAKIEEQLQRFKNKGVKIVITRHNEDSHHASTWSKELYHKIYEAADAVVHLGQYSLRHFVPLHAQQKQVVIVHPNYQALITAKNETRQDHNNNKQIVFQTFGAIRHRQEEEQIVEAFKQLAAPHTRLKVANSWLIKHRPSWLKNPIARMVHTFRVWQLKHKNIWLEGDKIANEDIPTLMQHTDVLIVPRINTLNSGLIFLGFTFKKIVMGPETGNLTEFLNIHNNPVFKPQDINSIASAMQKAMSLLSGNTGEMNKQFALEKCNPDELAFQHWQLYLQLQTIDA